VRKVRLTPFPGHELTVEDEPGRKAAKLLQHGSHGPARRLRTRRRPSVETIARKPSHLNSKDQPEPEGRGPERESMGRQRQSFPRLLGQQALRRLHVKSLEMGVFCTTTRGNTDCPSTATDRGKR
jgi:hypothetical protein